MKSEFVKVRPVCLICKHYTESYGDNIPMCMLKYKEVSPLGVCEDFEVWEKIKYNEPEEDDVVGR